MYTVCTVSVYTVFVLPSGYTYFFMYTDRFICYTWYWLNVNELLLLINQMKHNIFHPTFSTFTADWVDVQISSHIFLWSHTSHVTWQFSSHFYHTLIYRITNYNRFISKNLWQLLYPMLLLELVFAVVFNCWTGIV